MAITILPAVPDVEADAFASDSESGGVGLDEDTMDYEVEDGGKSAGQAPGKQLRLTPSSIMTPGEVVTDDPQWMRYDMSWNPDPPTPKKGNMDC